MKKLLVFAFTAMFLPALAWAQFSIGGKVLESGKLQALRGATLSLSNGQSVVAGQNGEFLFSDLPAGKYTLTATYVGYQSASRSMELKGNQQIEISLNPLALSGDEVVIRSTRATAQTATTYRNLDKAEIEKNNAGQDLPFLLNQTPNVVVSSDAGAGIGYTGIRIRGSDASRINVTLNGIPFNDPESQATYFVDLPDFASSVDNIQVQRGVGTSTNGAGAFGASINVQTTIRRDSAYAELNNSFGSYNSIKNTLNLGSGLINHQFSIDGRLSRINSDGYIDRAFSKLNSYFLSGAWYGANTLIRANVFSGKEKTYQAWNGVPEEMLVTNRTYNEFTYKDQTDNYTQDHYQLLYAHQFGPKLSLSGAFHYTYGRGYYEEYKEDQDFASYNLTPVLEGGVTIDHTNLVRRRWLDNDFYGATYALNFTPSAAWNFTLGGAYNEYKGRHFGEVISADHALASELNQHYYDNDGFKTDFNIYGKTNYQYRNWNFYADMQYRRVSHDFIGFDNNLQNVDQTVVLNFFNPKAGITYQLTNGDQWYASIAVANKEPNRDDFVNSTPNSRPKAERLTDWETGYRVKRSNYQVSVNAYLMNYKDQLVATGAINDVGEYTRQNVPDSYRLGLELDGKWQINSRWAWAANAAISRNKVKSFTNFVDDYDNGTQVATTYSDTDIAFSPAFVAGTNLAYAPFKNAEIACISKYVSRQYLDNTANSQSVIRAFFVNDLRLAYQFKTRSVKNIGLSLLVNNVFGEKYEANGYTYSYISGAALTRANVYYPQATRNFLFSLNLKF
ncbi:MAG: TonB-dependent receptor [Sphingobacteriaceae bacterium]